MNEQFAILFARRNVQISGRFHRKQPLRLHGRKALSQYSAQTRIVPLMIVCEGIRIKAHNTPFAAIVYRGKGDVRVFRKRVRIPGILAGEQHARRNRLHLDARARNRRPPFSA